MTAASWRQPTPRGQVDINLEEAGALEKAIMAVMAIRADQVAEVKAMAGEALPPGQRRQLTLLVTTVPCEDGRGRSPLPPAG